MRGTEMRDGGNVTGTARSDQSNAAAASWWLDAKFTPRAGIFAILAATALVYSRALNNEFVFDDHFWTDYAPVKSWSFFWKAPVNDLFWFLDPAHLPQSSYYRPIHSLWLATNYHLFGLHPAGWHATTIGVHLIVVFLAFRVASLLASDEWTGLFAATLFALMPVHAEAVIWPAAASYPISTAFALGAFEYFLRSNREADSSKHRHLAGSLGLFAGALLSHDSAASFPALIAAYAFIFPSFSSTPNPEAARSSSTTVERARNAAIAMLPYAIEVAGYLCLRYWIIGSVTQSGSGDHTVMAVMRAMMTLPSAFGSYLVLLAIPWMARPAHHLEIVRSFAAPGFYLPAAGLGALFVAGFAALRTHPHRRLYLFCTAWIVITLVPILVMIPPTTQDRYIYFPSFGFCVLAADIVVAFGRSSERRGMAVSYAMAAAAIIYGACLFSVQGDWHDDVVLCSLCTANNPDSAGCHRLLGLAYETRNQPSDARNELQRAVEIDPDTEWKTFHDLGRVDLKLGDNSGAEHALNEWLKRLQNPQPSAYAEFAFAADAAGDTKGAEAALAQAETLANGADIATLARAQLRFRHGDFKGAESALEQLLESNPNNVQALYVLGAVLFAERRCGDALAIYKRISSLAPGDKVRKLTGELERACSKP